MTSFPGGRGGARDDVRALTLGLVVWVVAAVVWWPSVASFGEDRPRRKAGAGRR